MRTSGCRARNGLGVCEHVEWHGPERRALAVHHPSNPFGRFTAEGGFAAARANRGRDVLDENELPVDFENFVNGIET